MPPWFQPAWTTIAGPKSAGTLVGVPLVHTGGSVGIAPGTQVVLIAGLSLAALKMPMAHSRPSGDFS
jgi:hypothetical protein